MCKTIKAPPRSCVCVCVCVCLCVCVCVDEPVSRASLGPPLLHLPLSAEEIAGREVLKAKVLQRGERQRVSRAAEG